MLATLRYRKTTVIAVAAVVGTVALLASFHRTKQYTSSVEVFVAPVRLAPDQNLAEAVAPNLSIEENLAQSVPVVHRVLRRLGASSPVAEVVAQLTVDTASDKRASVLVFTYRHPNPTVARQRAEAFAAEYVRDRHARVLAALQRRERRVVQQIFVLRQQARSLRRQAAKVHAPRLKRALIAQAELVDDLAFVQGVRRASLPQDPVVGTVAQPSSDPVPTPAPSHMFAAAIGLLIGLGAGIAVVGVSRYLDARPRTRRELESLVGAPVLACIPHTRARRTRRRPRVVVFAKPGSAAAETFRVLRSFVVAQHDPKVLLVVSADRGEGKSTVAANLAVALVEGGRRVALVCCNPQRPSIDKLFRLQRGPGLIDVLAGTADLHEVLKSPLEGLTILAAGRRPQRSGGALASFRMREVVRNLAVGFDSVILDGAQALGSADALAAATISDGVIFVADTTIGDVAKIADARRELEPVKAMLIGAVLNNSDESVGITIPARPRLVGSRVAAWPG